ncbi:MAG: succinate dehydrogenase, cytochrome b556 subunit [Candidatus Binatia bacterium]
MTSSQRTQKEPSLNDLKRMGLVPRRWSWAEAFTRSKGDPRHYGVGLWAWVLHRVTGLLLGLYLVLHLWTLGFVLAGSEALNGILAYLSRPIFHFFDLALFAGFLYHGLNGFRITLVDLMDVDHRRLFWMVIILTITLTVAAAPYFLHLV